MTDVFLKAFAPLSVLEPTVAEVIFPFVIHSIVLNLPTESQQVCMLSNAFARVLGDQGFSKCRRRLLLTTLTYLRKMKVLHWTHLQTSAEKRHQCSTFQHFYLNVPYLEVAKAAIDCELALTAIQTIHIWVSYTSSLLPSPHLPSFLLHYSQLTSLRLSSTTAKRPAVERNPHPRPPQLRT